MSTPSQLPLRIGSHHRNQYLFSDHYLDNLLPNDPRWGQALPQAEALLAWLQNHYQQEQNHLPHYNESQLEEHWFRPILAQLGHIYEPQASIPGLDRNTKRPDYIFFPSSAARQTASSAQRSAAYAAEALAVGEVKAWEVPLGKKQRGGGATFDAQNPSFQIDYYLRATGLTWGLLSNGRLWRLVHADTSQRLSIYYEVDLIALLQGDDPGALRYFSLFFRQEAFKVDPQGGQFLADALAASRAYALALEEDLKQNVYQALERLIQGFLDLPDNGLSQADLPEIYTNSLYLLYRLLFILYAESRGLLPLNQPDYREHYSLDRLKRQFARLASPPAPMTKIHWGDLQGLFQIINGDNAALNQHLGVPRYNGGLFDPRLHPFLVQKAVGDRALVEAINLLSRRETANGRQEFVDYRTLGVRQLGSIYEGLLEYQPRCAAEPMVAVRESKSKGERWVKAAAAKKATIVDRRRPDQVYLETDKGERKATGSYYTPQYIVEYIVENTLGPLVDEAREAVRARAKQAPTPAQRAQAEQSLVEAILNLKVLDPSMGSGHFLVEATEYLARAIATDYYVEAEEVTEEDLTHWRRRVVERCIYGVDKNPLAVELAKLSLWLATVAADKPLSFIDHHLKCGDALVGASVADLGEVPPVLLSKRQQQERRKLAAAGARQANLFEQRLSEKLPVMMSRVLEIIGQESDSYDTVQAKEAADRAVEALKAPFEAMAHLWTSAYFGHQFNRDDYDAALEALSQPERLLALPAIRQAQALADERRRNFFHWELAFPEVFYNRHGQPLGEKAGFDAVIGNPPYISAWSMTNTASATRIFITAQIRIGEGLTGHWDLYVPFLLKSYDLCKQRGYFSFIIPNPFCREKYAMGIRKFLLEKTKMKNIISFGEENIFDAVSRQTVIPVFNKSIPNWNSAKTQIDNPFEILDISQNNEAKSYEILQSTFYQFPEYQIRLEGKIERFIILEKIDRKSIALGNVCYVNYGAQVSSKKKGQFGKSNVISFLPKGNAKKFFDGKNIARYEVKWDGRYLDYRYKDMYGPRAPELFESPKILVRDVTGANEQLIVSYDEDGLYCDHLIICATYYENVEDIDLQTHFKGFDRLAPPYPSLLYITGMLASKLVTWYFQEVFATGTLQGSYSHTYPQQIRSFPVRRIDFITPAEERERLAEKGRNLYAQFCQKEDYACVLGFVEHQLSQEPERADVVHDLLAYLAEQMITMHQQKQQIVETFWLDVEGEVEAAELAKLRKGKQEATLARQEAIAPFVNPDSHSSRGLEEALAWDEAAFKAFVKVLARNLSGLSKLVGLYRAHSPDYGRLVGQIEATDRLIDGIVYRLYGLTEEEIEIVEGRA